MRPPRALHAALAALAMFAVTAIPAVPAGAQDEERPVPSIELRGALTPAAADWAGHALEQADADGAELAIVRLDSAGGIESAAREIVDHVRAATLPVVVYVGPGGAEATGRAASIVDAADVAAMAPGTSLDSEGNGLGENTALKQGRIDMIAADQDTLLDKLDGFRVEGPKAMTLSTSGVEIDDRNPTLPYQLAALLSNPNVAFLLLLVGILGLALEAFTPGAVIPGAIGAAALVLGVIGAVQLPLAAAGVALLAAGLVLLLAEARRPSGGLLGGFAVLALIGGGLLLFDTGTPLVAVSKPLVIAATAILGFAVVATGVRAVAARRGAAALAGPGGGRV